MLILFNKDIHLELLRELKMLRDFSGSLERIQIVAFFRSEDENSISNSKQEALELGVKAGFDKRNIEKLIKGELNSWVTKTRRAHKTGVGTSYRRSKWEKELRSLIGEKEERILFKLQQVPEGIDKAKTALEHGLNHNTETEALAEGLCCLGIDARCSHKKQINHMRAALLKEELPTVPHGLEGVMTSALVRYYEDFEPRDGKSLINDLSNHVLELMEHSSTAVAPRFQHSGIPATFYELLHSFWVFSRSRNIRYRLMAPAQRLVKSIGSWQEPSGAWRMPTFGTQQTAQPNTRLTALCVNFLLRYGQEGENSSVIANAVKWLLHRSTSDGGWTNERSHKGEPDVLTTILVLDSLRRASVAPDHHRVIKGEKALLSYQHATGYWLIKGVWAEYGTALAVEYLQAKNERGVLPNGYLLSAKRLIVKSEQLCVTGEASDVQLAVIAAYHGIEHFLYGVLLLDHLAEFHRTDGKTIGFRDAIGEFQRMIKRRNIIKDSEGLPYRTQLMQMALERDNFIHQSTYIPVSNAERHIECARKFVQRFDSILLGFPLVD